MSIHEVARRANVSTATVSRTINTPNLVDPQTAARVQQAIRDLNYVPDTHARSLVSGRSRILGLIVSDITNPFFPELIKEFGDVAIESGYDVLVGSTSYSPERMKLCVQRMLERKVDGIAVMTSEANEALVTQLGMQRIPITFLDNKPEGADFGIVRVDYARGIGEAVDHLLSLGHTCYAFIGGPAQLRSSAMRHEAFSRHLAENSRNGCIAIEVEANLTIDGGFQAMNAILERQQRVTAVMAANDLLAIGTLRAVRKAGFRVPQDISVVGFDDIHLAEYTEPPLTTVRLARDLLARRVVNSLISKVEAGGARLEAAEPVHTALVLRESTAAAARARVHTV